MTQHRFQPSHHVGRPKGSRNKLGVFYFDTLLKVASEPVAAQPQLPMTKLEEAMRAAYRREPLAFLKMITNTLPQEIEVTSAAASLTDEEIAEYLQRLKKSLAAPKPVLLEAKKSDEAATIN
jgi:FKBP-type peptidyl-prolyl cis-trans isomerase (trigger factor)